MSPALRTRQNRNFHWLLGLIPKQSWTGLRHDSWWESRFRIGRTFVKTVWGRISIYRPYRSWWDKLEPGHDGCDRKTGPLAIEDVGLRIWRRTSSWDQTSSCTFLSRLPSTRNDDTLENKYVPVQTFSDNAMSEDRSSVLTITNAKCGYLSKPTGAEEANEFTLWWENTGNTDRSNGKHSAAV